MAEEHSAKEAKFVVLQEKKAEEAKEKIAEAKEEKAEIKDAPAKKSGEAPGEKAEKTAETPAKGAEAKKEASETKKPAEVKKEEPKEEKKKREIVLERIYTVPMIEAYSKPAMARANNAIKLLRRFLARHMKAEDGKIKIAEKVNNLIRSRGSGRPMKSIKVKATKDKEGIVLAEIAA
ncbi:MAG: 50S ribosomal protein L31e [Candidatus Micrarchaeota archaeon]